MKKIITFILVTILLTTLIVSAFAYAMAQCPNCGKTLSTYCGEWDRTGSVTKTVNGIKYVGDEETRHINYWCGDSACQEQWGRVSFMREETRYTNWRLADQ